MKINHKNTPLPQIPGCIFHICFDPTKEFPEQIQEPIKIGYSFGEDKKMEKVEKGDAQ